MSLCIVSTNQVFPFKRPGYRGHFFAQRIGMIIRSSFEIFRLLLTRHYPFRFQPGHITSPVQITMSAYSKKRPLPLHVWYWRGNPETMPILALETISCRIKMQYVVCSPFHDGWSTSNEVLLNEGKKVVILTGPANVNLLTGNCTFLNRLVWQRVTCMLMCRIEGVHPKTRPRTFFAWDVHDADHLWQSYISRGATALLVFRATALFSFVAVTAFQGLAPSSVATGLHNNFLPYFTNWTFVMFAIYAFLGVAISIRGIKLAR